MDIEFAINNKTQGEFYVGYTPVSCSLRIKNGSAGQPPVSILIKNESTLKGGQLVFYSNLQTPELPAISVQVPQDGTAINFFIAGKYKMPSIEKNDAVLNFLISGTSALLVPMMVRVRKNANDLTDGERDRFLKAFLKFAQSGQYKTFLDMHDDAANNEIHKRSAFLPWHRLFVLYLERHLQVIDGSVAIPYWDFQHPAPKVFTEDFMGASTNSLVGKLKFGDKNPFRYWQLDKLPELARKPGFNVTSDKANVEDEFETLGKGPGFDKFALMEGNPHGLAHDSFKFPSQIDHIGTAPQDPLFFMLHANVDRLWAQWQSNDSKNRFDPNNPVGYSPSKATLPNPTIPRIGDFVTNTMWPWNGITGNGRPNSAPGGQFIDSPFSNFPGKQPTVFDSIDYQGRITGHILYFDYDSVPYINPNLSKADPAFLASEQNLHLEVMAKKITQAENAMIESEANFKSSNNITEIVTSLSQIKMLSDNDSIQKAIALLKDENIAAGARVLTLSRLELAVSGDESLFEYVLELLASDKNPSELRNAAFKTIQHMSFSSSLFGAQKPKIVETFRGLIHDRDIEIRNNVISFLAKEKDEVVQRELIDGLEHPENAVVEEELAIYLLGFDSKANMFPILRKIVQESSNNASRAQAIHLLGGDPEAKELLLNTFNNQKEKFDIRKNSLLAIKQQNPDEFIRLAQQTVINNNEHPDLRTLSLTSIDSGPKAKTKESESFEAMLSQMVKSAIPMALIIAIQTYLKNQQKDEIH